MAEQLSFLGKNGDFCIEYFQLREEELRESFTEVLETGFIFNKCYLALTIGKVGIVRGLEDMRIGYILSVKRDVKQKFLGVLSPNDFESHIAKANMLHAMKLKKGLLLIEMEIVNMVRGKISNNETVQKQLSVIHERDKQFQEKGILERLEFYEEMHRGVLSGSTIKECLDKAKREYSALREREEIILFVTFHSIKVQYFLPMPRNMETEMGRRKILEDLYDKVEEEYDIWLDYIQEDTVNHHMY